MNPNNKPTNLKLQKDQIKNPVGGHYSTLLPKDTLMPESLNSNIMTMLGLSNRSEEHKLNVLLWNE